MTYEQMRDLQGKLLECRDAIVIAKEASGQAEFQERWLREKFAEAAEILGYQLVECTARDLEFSR